MDFSLGYNLTKIGELMDELKTANDNTQKNIKSCFEDLKVRLRANWIGPDQQAFEKKLVERLQNLQMDAKNLVDAGIETVHSLATAWVEHQATNVFEGEARIDVDKMGLKVPDKIFCSILHESMVVYNEITFTGNENLGLAYSNSLGLMKSALETFVSTIKRYTNDLFASIDVNNAFYGDVQRSALKGYIEKVGYAVGEVQSCIKDFDEAMAILAGTNYDNAQTGVQEKFDAATSTVEGDLNTAYSGKRWTSSSE